MTEETLRIEGARPVAPVVIPTGSVDDVVYGLTKREYFAAMALHGLLANPDVVAMDDTQSIAQFAVAYAEALIAELNAPTK